MGKDEKNVETSPAKKSGRWKRLVIGIVITVAIVWGVFSLLPHLLRFVSFPVVFVDLSENLKDTPPGLFPDQTLTARYSIVSSGGHYEITVKGRVVGWPFTAIANVDVSPRFWGIDAKGTADVRLDGSQLGVSAVFAASMPGGWSVDVTMPEIQISDNDPFLRAILSRHPEEIVRKLVFDGIASLSAHADQDRIFRGIPRWEAKSRIKNMDISANANGKPVRIDNLRIGVGAKGIADHVDLNPMFPRVDCIEGAGCVLSNAFASVRATETALLVTEAAAEFCGGNIHLYSFFLDPNKLNAGVTVYMDGIDTGQALSHLKGFKGVATGKLNGKLPLRLKDGKELRFSKGYLHSVPGEIGNIKLYDPTPVTDNLMIGGVSSDAADNLKNVLSDLDYSALKIGLAPEEDGAMALSFKLEGTATRDGIVVPVCFTVTFHGDIEQLVNTGLRVATRKEQKNQ